MDFDYSFVYGLYLTISDYLCNDFAYPWSAFGSRVIPQHYQYHPFPDSASFHALVLPSNVSVFSCDLSPSTPEYAQVCV